MNQPVKIYLAGRNTGLSMAQCLEWRLQAQKLLAERGLLAHIPVDDVDWDKMLPIDLVNYDLDHIKKCQGMLVDVREPSWGTAMEVFWAKTVWSNSDQMRGIGFPIFGWRYPRETLSARHQSIPQLSPWIRAHMNGHTNNGLEDGVKMIADYLENPW